MTLDEAKAALAELPTIVKEETCEFCHGYGGIPVEKWWEELLCAEGEHRMCQACMGSGRIVLQANIVDVSNSDGRDYVIGWGLPDQ